MTTAITSDPVDLKAAARALGTAGGSAGAPRLLSLLCDADVELDAVLTQLKREPALTARVLKVANSPYYRQSGHVGTLERAVQMLGLTAIRGIAAAACLDRSAPPRAGQAFDPEAFRLHSLAVACAAQALSKAANAGVDGEAFMTGLLHDIGILLLAKADGQRMARFQVPQVASPDEAMALEREYFGVDHAEAAGTLVAAWALPGWLLAPLTTHHLPATGAVRGAEALPALVALADHVASRAGFALWPVCALPPTAALRGALPLDDAQIDALVEQLPALVAQLAEG